MDDQMKAAIKRIWQGIDTTHNLSAFWQDHFYSSGKKFGYPVCVQLINTLTKQVEDSVIVGYYRWPDTCGAVLEQVETYLEELDANKAKSQ